MKYINFRPSGLFKTAVVPARGVKYIMYHFLHYIIIFSVLSIEDGDDRSR